MAKVINKVIFGSDVLIDLTTDTVTAESLLEGKTAHDKSGAVITGSCTFDSDTTDADATDAEILFGKTAYVQKQKVTGTMPNNEQVNGKIKNLTDPYTIPVGYHDGSGTVTIEDTEKAKILPENIREGVEILGVSGTMSSTEGVKAEKKTVTPTKEGFTVLPGASFNYLSEVVVNPISYTLTDNQSGGQTATIAAPTAEISAQIGSRVVR